MSQQLTALWSCKQKETGLVAKPQVDPHTVGPIGVGQRMGTQTQIARSCGGCLGPGKLIKVFWGEGKQAQAYLTHVDGGSGKHGIDTESEPGIFAAMGDEGEANARPIFRQSHAGSPDGPANTVPVDHETGGVPDHGKPRSEERR